ncbi:2-oxo-4-hydroxy-4-carboxy-5-ureidoimidazoline decarboxylase [Kutzneria viridogrisea]|uniref:2-oxo-4-hydroxy-4-carboxy-5-ureidoimidazoline decarboxylase n=1 Tax=Kutzneria viridogrisea TaxID=47990 RepID=A0ABR6BCG6_9PSEU|nr:2-oxo-4-hydroxy-4-carboxy-5-ureidoimidazoline decarboxylase [Kutzneria viridogrisea]
MDLNSAPEPDLAERLTTCLAVPRWVREVLAGRPYADEQAVLVTAERAAAELTDEELTTALAGHPRIGERAASGDLGAAWSRSEQSGVDGSAAEEFVVANEVYERRFGRIYLVCAAGRSGPELLADLRSRLDNDPVTELAVTKDELRKIALLRLRKVLES